MWIVVVIVIAVIIAVIGYILIYSGSSADIEGDGSEICGECESYNKWFGCCDETNGYRRPSDRCNARKDYQ